MKEAHVLELETYVFRYWFYDYFAIGVPFSQAKMDRANWKRLLYELNEMCMKALSSE